MAGSIPQRAGAATADELAHLNAIAYGMNRSLFNAPSALIGAIGHGAYDFGRGFFGGAPADAAPAAVHPAVAAAMNQAATGVPVTQLTDKSIKQYGALSPAARAVLGNIDVNGVVKNAPNAVDPNAAALKGVPTMMQLMAGYAAGHGGNISPHMIDVFSGAAQKGAAAAAATSKEPNIRDIAGAQALQFSNQFFNAQKDSAAKANNGPAYEDAARRHLEFLKELSGAKPYDLTSPDAYGQQPPG